MSYTIEIIKTNLIIGEGPHWVPSQNALYLNDIPTGKILKIDVKTNKITSLKIKDTPVSFIIPVQGKEGQFIIGCKKNITLLEWNGQDDQKDFKIKVLATVTDGDRLNDGKADPVGRLWAGTMGKEDNGRFEDLQGKLYVFESGKAPREQLKEIGISNGIAWSLDHKTMYYNDSLRYTVDALDYDIQKGEATNRRVIFDFRKNHIKGFPDGMTIDKDGMLWVACFEGAQVIRVDPNQSKLLQQIPLPAPQITSVTFGGENHDELWVTSGNKLDRTLLEKYPESGNVFRIKGLGVSGLPSIQVKM